MNKRILAAILCLLIVLISGCGKEVVSYNGDVTALITNDTDTFTQSVSDEHLREYYEYVNRIGFNILSANGDKYIGFSPLTISNSIIDLSQVISPESRPDIEKLIPSYEDFMDARTYSENMYSFLNSSKTIWVTSEMIKQIKPEAINGDMFNGFDFYILRDANATRKQEINSYVKEKLGVSTNVVKTKNSNVAEVVDIDFATFSILAKASNYSYSIDDIKYGGINKKINYFNANDIYAKYVITNGFRVVELPTDLGDNIVIDILNPMGSASITETLNEKYVDIFDDIDNASYGIMRSLSIPLINNVYNMSEKTIYKNAGMDFIYGNISREIANKDISVDQINQIAKTVISFSIDKDPNIESSSTVEFKLTSPFAYVLRDTSTNLVLFIGTFNF